MSRVVSRGAIRVDARRAVAKLREHLLVDLHLYLLELVRAAAAGGATAVALTGDADELCVSFDGQPLDPATLERLLDHVLDAPRDREGRRARLLALGVNAALGLGPSRIDVYTTTAPGRCARARFTPAVVEAAPGDAAARPACAEVAAPAGMPAQGTRIEVRRKLGWGVLRRAVSGTRPPEIDHLAAATADLPIPITLDGAPLARAAAPAPLLRVPFHVRGAARAALEILPAPSAQGPGAEAPAAGGGPALDLLEHGVRLLREAWSFEPRFPSASYLGVSLPVRVLLDAEELPTNASRSALREDAPIRALLAEAAHAAFLDALKALAALGCGVGAVPEGVVALTADREALAEALGAIACVAAGAAEPGRSQGEEAQRILELPLLRDGLGRPIAPASLPWRVYTWPGKEPVPEAAAPWANEIVWLRGRVAERVLGRFRVEDAGSIVAKAKQGEQRRKALYAHAPGEPTVPPAQAHLARAAFEVKEGPVAGLRGEIAILAVDPAAPAPASIRVLYDGRVLDTLALDRAAAPLPFEAALAWDGRLRPQLTYEGVEQDDALRAAVGHALRLALLTVDREARRLHGIAAGQEAAPRAEGSQADRDRLRPAVRAAVGALLAAREGLSPLGERGKAKALGEAEELGWDAFPGLHRAPVWPTTVRDRCEGLQGLIALTSLRKAVCVAPPGAQGRAADGRPVIALRPEELAWLGAALQGAELIPYERALCDSDTLRRREQDRRAMLSRALTMIAPPATPGEAPVLEWSRPWITVLITPAEKHEEAWHHALHPLEVKDARPALAPAAIAVDSDSVMPDRTWRKVLSGRTSGAIASAEKELCALLASMIEGDPAAAARLGVRPPGELPGGAVSTRITAHLIRSAGALARLTSGKKVDAADRELLERIRKLPLVAVLDADGKPTPASLDDVEAAHPPAKVIPVLDAAPGFETLDWRPVVVRDKRERDALVEWAGKRVALASGELAERWARAEAGRIRRAFLAGPAHDVRDLGDLSDPARGTPPPITVFIPAAPPATRDPAAQQAPPPAALIPVAAALPRAGVHVAHAWVDVLFSQRALCRRALPLALPVVARVDLSDPDLIQGFCDLSPAGVAAVSQRVFSAALALAFRILTEACLPGRSAVFFRDPRAILLAALLITPADGRDPASAAQAAPLATSLRGSQLRWPTVRGTDNPLEEIRAAGQELFFGAQLHVPWREGARRSDLDSPVLHLPATPAGDAMKALLRALGYGLRDVSAAIAALQARRDEAAPQDAAPRLPGAPPHPLLRVTLAALKVREAEGEAEAIEGPASEVQLIGLDGAPQRIDAEMALPMRIVARVEHAHPTRENAEPLLKRLSKAMGRHLLAQGERMDELPPFVRAHLRRAVCKTASEGKEVVKDGRSAPLFQDTRGAWYSLEALQKPPKSGWWGYTTAWPPYPQRDYDPPILCLTRDESALLGAKDAGLSLRDLTMAVARDLDGERRAAAPPLATIALDAAVRARCFAALPFADTPGASGEIGLLLPAHAADAGIAVHAGRRPLCRLDAGEGWPLCAAVNDDALEPNRHFDGLRTTAAGERLRARVREAATRWLKARVSAPADALAARWVEGRPSGRVFVAGLLWLPAAWPTAPRVQATVPTPDGGYGGPRALSLPVAAKGISGVIPVGGTLLVWPDGAWSEVAQIALRAAASMIAEIAATRLGDPELLAYQWNLRLLGASEGGAPRAPAVDGKEIGIAELTAELSSRGCVWVTRGEGSAFGRFPEGAPGFVLRDGSPLVHVLRHRGVDLVRELGGIEAAPEAPPEPTPAPPPIQVPEHVALLAPDGAPPPGPFIPSDLLLAPDRAAFEAPPAAERAGRWVAQLWRSVRRVLTGGGAAADTSGESELAAAVHEALAGLRLSGDPVGEVQEARSGRPVRYEAKARRVLLNPRHESLAWTRGRAPRDPAVVALLVAAAVGEINRALQSVTDAEERRALDELLRSLGGEAK